MPIDNHYFCKMILTLDKVVPILQEVFHPIFRQQKLNVKVLRLDLIDPITGGNKWFKLKFNLEEAKKRSFKTIISFGGPYSNHIAALASAGAIFGFETVGLIRGKLHDDNPTLKRAKLDGMKLIACEYEKYRAFRNPDNWNELLEHFPNSFIIPEGGSNQLGLHGCKLIAKMIPDNTTSVFLPVGTGTTIAGLISGSEGKFLVEGIAVVKAEAYLKNEVDRMVQEEFKEVIKSIPSNYLLHHDFTFGGYAKSNLQLSLFIENFHRANSIPIEPIYTGRMFYAIVALANSGYFSDGASVVAIHTGGNQYNVS